MPPNTKDVNLHKDVEGAKSTAIREIFVINLPDSSDLKTKAWEFEDALNEIGEKSCLISVKRIFYVPFKVTEEFSYSYWCLDR